MNKAQTQRDTKHTDKPGESAQPQVQGAGVLGSVLSLQQMIGNQAVQGLLTGHEPPASPGWLQTKLVAPRSGTPDISREDDPETIAREHTETGMNLFNAGNYEEAIAHFERARQVPTLAPRVYARIILNLGMCNFRLQRFATAIHYLEQAQTMDISEEQLANVEATLEQARAGTSADAERILDREDADIPAATGDAAGDEARAQALFQQADELFTAGQFRQALILFEQVREMESQPEHVRNTMIFNIAECNLRLGRAATAISYLEDYLRTPGANRSRVIELLTASQEAAGTLTSDEQMQMVFRLGREAHNAGQYADAVRLYQLVIDNPAVEARVAAEMHYNLGLSLFEMGRYEEALTHFQEYAAFNPAHAEVQAHIAECESHIGTAVPEAE
jgi:tetratricopeptide (TPR) repeat protein